MTPIKRLASATVFTLFVFTVTALAQTPRVSTVNITPESDRVRINAVGEVSELSIEVLDEAGEIVLKGQHFNGQTLAWNMRDAQGRKVAPGTYTVTVSYRTLSGKLRKRVEQVWVSEEVTAEESQSKTETQAASEPPTPTAVGTITGEGAVNRIPKFNGANSIGNSAMSEVGGKVGINNPAPTHALTINGGPSWTANGWLGSVALPTGGAVGWATNSAGQRAGIGHTNGGLFFFRTQSNPGGTGFGAIYDMIITDQGRVGIGTITPTSRLEIAAQDGLRITGFQPFLTLNDTNTNLRSILAGGNGDFGFYPNSFIGGSPPVIIRNGSGNVGIGTTSPLSKLTVQTASENYGILHSNGMVQVGTWAGSGATGTQSGWFGTKTNHPLRFFTNDSGAAMTILPNGRVGIGTANPVYKLHVDGGNGSSGVFGSSTSSIGVYGNSTSGTGVRGISTSGIGVYGENSNKNSFAGYFLGEVVVTEELSVLGGCNGCSPPSDRHRKANFSAINPRLILDRLATVPIQTWNYKSEPESVRHIGPMAQDFRAAFGLGANDHTLNTVDAQGVTMASVQALYQLMLEKDRELKQLRAQLLQQQAQLKQVRRTIRRGRAARR